MTFGAEDPPNNTIQARMAAASQTRRAEKKHEWAKFRFLAHGQRAVLWSMSICTRLDPQYPICPLGGSGLKIITVCKRSKAKEKVQSKRKKQKIAFALWKRKEECIVQS